jgi:hypothetical protein
MTRTSRQPAAVWGTLSCLADTRPSRRYRRLYHAFEPQLDWMLTVDPVLRRHVAAVLQRIAEVGLTQALDGAALASARHVLDDLGRLGDVELQREVAALRDELDLARGHTLTELLAG